MAIIEAWISGDIEFRGGGGEPPGLHTCIDPYPGKPENQRKEKNDNRNRNQQQSP